MPCLRIYEIIIYLLKSYEQLNPWNCDTIQQDTVNDLVCLSHVTTPISGRFLKARGQFGGSEMPPMDFLKKTGAFRTF